MSKTNCIDCLGEGGVIQAALAANAHESIKNVDLDARKGGSLANRFSKIVADADQAVQNIFG